MFMPVEAGFIIVPLCQAAVLATALQHLRHLPTHSPKQNRSLTLRAPPHFP